MQQERWRSNLVVVGGFAHSEEKAVRQGEQENQCSRRTTSLRQSRMRDWARENQPCRV